MHQKRLVAHYFVVQTGNISHVARAATTAYYCATEIIVVGDQSFHGTSALIPLDHVQQSFSIIGPRNLSFIFKY
jgi:hypothetical protein